MKQSIQRKLDRIDKLAEEDELYQYLMGSLAIDEEELSDLERELSLEQRDVLWRFIMRSEEISLRKLVIACKNMDFKGPVKRFFFKN